MSIGEAAEAVEKSLVEHVDTKNLKTKNRAVSKYEIAERQMPRPSVESAADLTDVFDTEKFALAASYTVTGGSAAMVNGLFDERHVAVDVGGQVQVADVAPQFQCATSDVSSADMCAAITVNSVAYAVVEVQSRQDGCDYDDLGAGVGPRRQALSRNRPAHAHVEPDNADHDKHNRADLERGDRFFEPDDADGSD